MPPKKPVQHWWHWFTDASPLVKIVGGLAAILGLITVIPGAWGVAISPVHHLIDGRVDLKFGPLRFAFDSTSSAVRDLQIENVEGKLEANRNAIVNWEVEKIKNHDAKSRDLIDAQLRELANTRGRLEEQLKTLREIRRRNDQ